MIKKTGGIVLVCCLLTSGCAMKKSPQPTLQADYYPACVRPLAAMQEADNQVGKTTAVSTLVGGLFGAAVGLVTTGKPAGALVGAVGGAAGGAVIGYSYAKSQQISDENARFASIRMTANQYLTKVNRQQLYAYESLQCYMHEFEGLQKAYRNKMLTQEDYRVRYAEIRTNMKKLGDYIGLIDSDIIKSETEFENAYTSKPASAQKGTAAANAPRKHPKPKPAANSRKARNSKDITRKIAQQRARIEKEQKKNDLDMLQMTNEFSGKSTPPKQNPDKIVKDYEGGYNATQQQMEDLRATHKAALDIMDKAAIEAGIDMV